MVSVIICTRNRRSELAQTLDALQDVELPAGTIAELVVVDNGSTDGTAELIRAHAWSGGPVRCAYEPRTGKGNAYNRGIASAAGEILLLTDDDVRPPAHWLATMCEPIQSGRADMVAGGVRFAPHLNRAWMTPQLRAYLSSTELLEADHPDWVVAANLAFSRSVLERVPAFDPELGPGALGFEDEALFGWQVSESGLRVIGRFEDPVEHWFDERRLARRSLVDYMRRLGRSKAYVEYHWLHRDVRRPRLARRRAWVRWLAWLALHPSQMLRAEGITEHEADLLGSVGYFEQFLVERRRPRNYALRGLVKRSHE